MNTQLKRKKQKRTFGKSCISLLKDHGKSIRKYRGIKFFRKNQNIIQ